MKAVCLVWAVYFGSAAVCQLAMGDVPADFFAFPVNVALMLLWIVLLWVLYRERRDSRFVKSMLDRRTTLVLSGMFALCCVAAGLCARRVSVSWWFSAALFALLSHLFLVTIDVAGRRRPYRLRFILNHAGLMLALSGGFWGSADAREWRAQVAEGDSVEVMYDATGGRMTPEREIRVMRLESESYPDGTPQGYEARLVIGGESEAVLRVNSPYALSWRDNLYLMSFGAGEGAARSCVLLLVREPWRWVMWCGIVMLMAGGVLMFVQGVDGKRSEG